MKRAVLALSCMALLVLMTAACPKKVKRPLQPPIPPPVETLPAMPPETPIKPVTPTPDQGRLTQTPPSLAAIHFDFDKYDIRPGDAKILESNAELLRNGAAMKVTLEGYTDPVGTDEYNRGLGLRRSTSAKAYLVKLGLDAVRFTTISYGKEKPVTSDSLQYEMNRRVEFVPQQ